MSDQLLTNFELAHDIWREAKLNLANAEYDLSVAEAMAVFNAGNLGGNAETRKHAIVIAIDGSKDVKLAMTLVRDAQEAYLMADGALQATIHALKNYRAQLRHDI